MTRSMTLTATVRCYLIAGIYTVSFVGNTLRREVSLNGFYVRLVLASNHRVRVRVPSSLVLNTRPLDVVWGVPKESVRDAKDVHCAEKTPAEGSARVALPVSNVRTQVSH